MANARVKLAYRFVPGIWLTYNSAMTAIHVTAAGNSSEQKITETAFEIRQLVAHVDADGTAVVNITIVQPEGTPEGTPPPRPIQVRMSPTGELLDCSIDLPTRLPRFPASEVEVGQTWEQTVPMSLPTLDADGVPNGSQTEALVYAYTLEDIQRSSGGAQALIEMTVREAKVPVGPGVQMSISGRGQMRFDVEHGRLESSDVVTTTIATAEEGTVTTTVRIMTHLAETSES